MNATEWREVKVVLQQAMEAPPAERPALLDAACGGRPELRREVMSLLAAHDEEQAKGDPLWAVVAAGRRSASRRRDPVDDLRRSIEAELGDRFDVLGTLGTGGMGTVLLAHERALGRAVAIKVLRPDRATAPRSHERFRREARIAAGLSHPGIVSLHAFGEVNGLWYFVMEYVRGPSLARRIELEGPLPTDEVRRIVLAIADALEHTHRHGVIHRDIKPANILLDEETDRPRLADFGISELDGAADDPDDDDAASGAVTGTPLYMSPEQAAGETDIDARSDIYSLGAVAYELLSGRPPFAGDSAREMLYHRLVADPPPLAQVAPGVPTDLADVVMRCLARERDARWPDAAALRSALRATTSDRARDLPPAIADVAGFASYAIAWSALWISLAVGAGHPVTRALLLLLSALVPVGLVLHLWRLRTHAIGLRRLLRIAVWPPQWWGMWWPRALRHPDDLWPLLPSSARAARVVLSLFCLAIPVVALAIDRGAASWRTMLEWAAAPLVGVTALLSVIALVSAMRRGLSFECAAQFLTTSTAPSAFWQDPVVARLLTPAGRLVRPPLRGDADDHRRAIDEMLRRFPSLPDALRAMVRRAAEHQASLVEQLDREIAALGHDASPAEAHRVEMRLSALEERDDGSGQHLAMVDGLRDRLTTVRRAQGRLALAMAERSGASALLGALWTRLAQRVEAQRDDGGSVRDTGERLESLCARILGDLDDDREEA